MDNGGWSSIIAHGPPSHKHCDGKDNCTEKLYNDFCEFCQTDGFHLFRGQDMNARHSCCYARANETSPSYLGKGYK